MNMLALVLAIFAALAFLAGILQGIVAAKDIITHSVRSGQQRSWLVIISICILLTVIFGYASYKTQDYNTSLPKPDSPSSAHSTIATSGSSSPTQSATPTKGISLSPTPTTPASSILYRADWSTGKAGWSAPSTSQSDAAWSVNNGELLSNGQTLHDPNPSGFSTIQAPYHPEDYGIQDYAVEAEILVKSKIPDEAENAFGIGVRRYFDASQNLRSGIWMESGG